MVSSLGVVTALVFKNLTVQGVKEVRMVGNSLTISGALTVDRLRLEGNNTVLAEFNLDVETVVLNQGIARIVNATIRSTEMIFNVSDSFVMKACPEVWGKITLTQHNGICMMDDVKVHGALQINGSRLFEFRGSQILAIESNSIGILSDASENRIGIDASCSHNCYKIYSRVNVYSMN